MRGLVQDLIAEYREEGWVIPVLVAAWAVGSFTAIVWIWRL